MQREVRDSVGEVLIRRNLATRVYRTRELVADEPEEAPRTGKSKRKYKRRDLAAED